MSTRTIFLLVILSLNVFASANAQTKGWPFSDGLLTEFVLHGIDEHISLSPYDTTTEINDEYMGMPFEMDPPIFTQEDVTSTTNGWNLSQDWEFATVSMNLTVDTAAHIINSLNFTEVIWNEQGDVNIVLKDLIYFDSSYGGIPTSFITFPDNDLMRHVVSASYYFFMGHSADYEGWRLLTLDGLLLDSSSLIVAFQAPTMLDFGQINVGRTTDTSIVINNRSNVPLNIRSYTIYSKSYSDSAFSFLDTTLHTIAAEDSGTITIRFLPRESKTYSGNIQITTDEPFAPPYSIQLTGVGTSSSVRSIPAIYGELNILPDITNGTATISLPSSSGSLAIFDILGSKVYSTRDLNNTSLSLDTHSWQNGTYFVVFHGTQGSTAAKFIVQH